MKRLRWETRAELRQQRDLARTVAVKLENDVARLEAEANNLAALIVRRSTAHARYVTQIGHRITERLHQARAELDR